MSSYCQFLLTLFPPPKVLGLEGNATIATEVSLWDGVEVTPGVKVYDAELERKKMEEEEAADDEEMEGVEAATTTTTS